LKSTETLSGRYQYIVKYLISAISAR